MDSRERIDGGNEVQMCVRLQVVLAFVALVASGAPAALQKPCASPEYHQFDFWIGDWDVFDSDSTTATAHVRVDSILGVFCASITKTAPVQQARALQPMTPAESSGTRLG